MSTGLNLTDDQRRRIEGAGSPEERAAIIMEAVGEPRELGLEDMDAVSGGNKDWFQEVVIPPTHEEIDVLWDAVEKYSQDVASQSVSVTWVLPASLLAFELKLIPWHTTYQNNGTSYFVYHTIDEERAKMHRMLNARQGK